MTDHPRSDEGRPTTKPLAPPPEWLAPYAAIEVGGSAASYRRAVSRWRAARNPSIREAKKTYRIEEFETTKGLERECEGVVAELSAELITEELLRDLQGPETRNAPPPEGSGASGPAEATRNETRGE